MEYADPKSYRDGSYPPSYAMPVSEVMSAQQAYEGRRTLHIYQTGNSISSANACLTYRVTDNGKVNELYTVIRDPKSDPPLRIFSSMPLQYGNCTLIGSANVPVYTQTFHIPTKKINMTVRNNDMTYEQTNPSSTDLSTWSWTSPAFGGNTLIWTRTVNLSKIRSCFIGSRSAAPVATYERTMAISKRGKIHIHDPAIQYGSPAFDELVVSALTYMELEKDRDRARSN